MGYALLLMVVLAWPIIATLWAVARGESGGLGIGGGLMTPPPESAPGSDGSLWPRELVVLGTSLKLVAITELIALPIGVVLALLLAKTDVLARRFAVMVMIVAMFVPLPLYASAWLGGFGNAGRSQAFGLSIGPILQGVEGAAFVHALAVLPWVVVILSVGFRLVEPELEELLWLDRPAWWVLFRLTLRRSLGAILTAVLVVAVFTAGDMTITDLLQVRTYAEEAYLRHGLGDGPGAAGLAALPGMGMLAVLILLLATTLGRAEPMRRASPFWRSRTWRLESWRLPASVAAWLLVGFLTMPPVLALAWRAGRVGGSAAAGRRPSWSLSGLMGTLADAFGEIAAPCFKSVVLATITASLVLILAWPMAYLARGRGPWRIASMLAVAIGLAAPGPITGMALVLAWRDVPWVYDSLIIVILAYLPRCWALAVVLLWPVLRMQPREHHELAAVEGIGPMRRAWLIALPLSRSACLLTWCVCGLLAFGELPAANLVEPPTRVNLATIRVWQLLHTGVESHLAGVALAMMLVVGVMVLPMAWWATRCVDGRRRRG